MRLILMRHGKAVGPDEAPSNADRSLSLDGRLALNEELPYLARYLRHTNQCHIWHSPLARSRETAEILIRYMPGQTIEARDFIADGNEAALVAALKTLPKEATLVIIGHEPHLSVWLENLARRRDHFKKGESAVLLLDPENPYDAVRMTTIRLKELSRLGPVDLPLPVAMHEILLDSQKDILKEKDRVLTDVESEEAIHNLRVALRRQKSYLALIKPFADKAIYRKAQKSYSKLLEELSHLRETDVILSTIHEAKLWELAPIVSPVQAERNAEALALDMRFSQADSDRAYAEAYAMAMEALATIDDNRIFSGFAEKQMPKRFKKLRRQAKQLIGERNHRKLHRLRVKIKHHRYLYERLACMAHYDSAQRYRLLTRLQKTIGDYTDTFFNSAVLHDMIAEQGSITDPHLERAMHVYDDQQEQIREEAYAKTQELLKALAQCP